MNRLWVRLSAVVLSLCIWQTATDCVRADDKKAMTAEEERLQRFWHDYSDSLKRYYESLDRIDWIAYYKNHGYQVNPTCTGPNCGQRINHAPVFVAPNMQWRVPTP